MVAQATAVAGNFLRRLASYCEGARGWPHARLRPRAGGKTEGTAEPVAIGFACTSVHAMSPGSTAIGGDVRQGRGEDPRLRLSGQLRLRADGRPLDVEPSDL